MQRPRYVSDAIEQQPSGLYTGRYGEFCLEPAFQPIVRLSSGKLVLHGFEGLIRPRRNKAPVSPAELFASVDPEDRLFIESMSRAMHIRNYALARPRGRKLYVNINPAMYPDTSAIDREFDFLLSVLPKYGLRPEWIVCEIVETCALTPEILQALARKLVACGFNIALDDFGSEASDIERYFAIRPSIVKLDRDYFNRLSGSAVEMRLLASVMNTFIDNGTAILVEGIETREQLDVAIRLGATLFQGFGIARPHKLPHEFPMTYSGPLPKLVAANTA